MGVHVLIASIKQFIIQEQTKNLYFLYRDTRRLSISKE